MVDDVDGEDDDEHAHMDDSFMDPDEMMDDDICPLSHDDELGMDGKIQSLGF